MVKATRILAMRLHHNRIGSLGPWAIGSALFRSNLSLQGVSIAVTASGEGSIQQLNVKARRGDKAFPSIQETLEGRVVGAEVEDLNSDGLPDLSGGTRQVTSKPGRSTQF
ncbi:hypothetical protein FQK07_12175 [Synechococcus sp. BSF8S]|nr:hypothetical protein [Synechococcus sp. BSA11S]MBC1262006.1 hypothetical protein [Synechococcus sp. BSF8S]MBC1264933.1 hypothetical protein [Synechococcus sp. BSA11S]